MSDAYRASESPVLDVIDDGLTDDDIAARTRAWLSELNSEPPLHTSETAAEALHRLYAAGDL